MRENAATFVFSPKRDKFDSPQQQTYTSDHFKKRSATPKAGKAINLTDVDKYVGKINQLQVGQSKVSTKVKRTQSKLNQSFKVTPANINDEFLASRTSFSVRQSNKIDLRDTKMS